MNIDKIRKGIEKSKIEEIIYFEEVDSTNDIAKKENITKTSLIITDNQIKGRGTGNNKWQGSKKNITMTIVSIPNCKISDLDTFTIKVGEKIKEVIKEKYDIELVVKYPNDLLLNNRKICGILTESILRGEVVKKLIIGIGFNVNEEFIQSDIKNIATSLKIETKKEYIIEEVLCNICNGIIEII